MIKFVGTMEGLGSDYIHYHSRDSVSREGSSRPRTCAYLDTI